MALTLRDRQTAANLAAIDADGALHAAIRGMPLPAVSVTVAAAATGVLGPIDVGYAGNISFIVRNAVPATGWTGAPVIAFEQSDDGVSWAPLMCVRSDTAQIWATHTLGVGAANTSVVFDAALEGVNFVRARVTTGTATGAVVIAAQPGGLPFSPVVAVSSPVRAPLIIAGTALAAAATGVDALLTLAQVRGVAAGSGVSYTIPAGRRLRIQALVFTQVGSTTATAAQTTFRMRYNPAGAVTLTSTPILLPVRLASPATALSFQQWQVALAEGYEIAGDGVASIGFTAVSTYTTNAPTLDVQLVGYEY